ncbi:P60-like protein [Choiromyces venosus 120613-1]|uniref:Ribosome biogenesis protein NOP53 n=1 Tax=Choiromyces venosus 120613-1 TaxID=1336337 RepID=A0A3N4K4T3_9PEZI|nr:P60-like protein [Choiromyces venosus 120613-1]
MASRQPSRKGKKAWRKNVDITDVSAGLENLREEIIHGGVVKEKADNQLFALDTTGDISVAKSFVKKLKSDEILSSRSALPAIEGRKRTHTTTTTPIAHGTGILPVKKRRSNGVSYKDLDRLRSIATNPSSHHVPRNKDDPEMKIDYDPWATPIAAPEEILAEKYQAQGLTFLEAPTAVKEPITLKQPPISLAQTGKPVPAVRRPEAGISYNPEFEKWDALLRSEGEKAIKEEKQRLEEVKERERIKALAAVPDPEPASESESDSDTDEETTVKKKKQPERKTQAQRNKQLRRKAQELTALRAKLAKKQAVELSLIRKYAKDADRRLALAKSSSKPELQDDEKNPKLMRKRRFGTVGMGKAPLELQLPDELADSLRTLKPEGSLLRDRFRSLRERGVVESRKRIVERRKYARKVSERWSYKDFK